MFWHNNTLVLSCSIYSRLHLNHIQRCGENLAFPIHFQWHPLCSSCSDLWFRPFPARIVVLGSTFWSPQSAPCCVCQSCVLPIWCQRNTRQTTWLCFTHFVLLIMWDLRHTIATQPCRLPTIWCECSLSVCSKHVFDRQWALAACNPTCCLET